MSSKVFSSIATLRNMIKTFQETGSVQDFSEEENSFEEEKSENIEKNFLSEKSQVELNTESDEYDESEDDEKIELFQTYVEKKIFSKWKSSLLHSIILNIAGRKETRPTPNFTSKECSSSECSDFLPKDGKRFIPDETSSDTVYYSDDVFQSSDPNINECFMSDSFSENFSFNRKLFYNSD